MCSNIGIMVYYAFIGNTLNMCHCPGNRLRCLHRDVVLLPVAIGSISESLVIILFCFRRHGDVPS